MANIKLLQNKELEISMATTLSSYQAYAAEGPYKGTEKGKILSWMGIAPVAMHIITLEDSGINTVEDLKGKRVGMGQPGGVSMLDADAMMETLGFKEGDDFKAFRIKLGAMANGLADGNLDAALWNGSFPQWLDGRGDVFAGGAWFCVDFQSLRHFQLCSGGHGAVRGVDTCWLSERANSVCPSH